MRIVALSDIHGNLPALEAVLAEVARLGADVVVNLGDIVSGPLWPRETAQRLMALALPTIAGNHERQLLTIPRERQSASDAHAAAALGGAERAWLRGLPAARQLADDVACCHGTPASDLHYLLETVTTGFGIEGSRGVRAASADEVAARCGGIDVDVGGSLLLCGHSHVPRALRLAGGMLVVNPGSVGLQAYDDDQPAEHWVEMGSPHARWALVERQQPGADWNVALMATAYDWEAAARQAERNGRGDWADALRTGRVGRTEREARSMSAGAAPA